MANTVFRIIDDKIIVHPEAVKLSPVLSDLDEKELRYIILVYDYIKSPYRMRAVEDRKRVVKSKVFGNKNIDPEKSVKIKEAIKEYQSLIYHPKYEEMEIIRQKMKNINEKILNIDEEKEGSMKKIKDMDGIAMYFQKRFDELEAEVEAKEESMIVKGDYKLSFLENWQINRMKKIKNKET